MISSRFGKTKMFPLLLVPAVIHATRNGLLPGGSGYLWAILQVALWGGFYIALCRVYIVSSIHAGKDDNSACQKVGISLLLSICSVLAIGLFYPDSFKNIYYIKYLAVPVFGIFWFSLLLRWENVLLYRNAMNSVCVKMALSLVILLFLSFIMISLSDYAVNRFDSVEDFSGYTLLDRRSWVTNSLILFASYALVFAISCKLIMALLCVTPLFIVLNLATFAKLKYMHAPVYPLDLINIPEFLPLFKGFFGNIVFAVSVVSLIAWILALVYAQRKARDRYPPRFRMVAGGLSLIVLSIVPVLYAWPHHDMDKYFEMIGGPNFITTADYQKTNGILLTFVAEVPSSFVKTPSNYTYEAVRDTATAYYEFKNAAFKQNGSRKPNLIIIMLESFMDPLDLGYEYSGDPIPYFRSNQSGNTSGSVIVPESFGGSINSEFEILTGMSTLFLPTRSIPYRQHIKTPVHSLPGALKKSGYRTIAIQADPRDWFNREKAYDLLGFDETFFLHEDQAAERTARGWWVSDKAVMEKIKEAGRGKKPFFVFAFPSSTHSPYDTGFFADSALKVVGRIGSDVAAEVKEYINLLRESDRVIGEIIEYYRERPDPTMIVVLGDHLPPLSDQALRPFFSRLSGLPEHQREWMTRRVPILVAANYGLPGETIELSLNNLPSYLLEKMGIPPSGFLSAGDIFRRKIPVYSTYVKGSDGGIWHRGNIPPEERAFVDNYSLLQFDTLIGRRYFLGPVTQ